MKKQILISLILLISVLTMNAQTQWTYSNGSAFFIGNIGIGLTNYRYSGPSQYGGIEFPRGEILFSNTNSQNQLYLLSNAYQGASGVPLLRNTGMACGMGFDDGNIAFYTANDIADAPLPMTSKLIIKNDGSIGIGTFSPAYKLDVCGTIRAKEVKVDLLGGCDFVFKSDYKLMDLKTLELFVQTNQHLPEIASEKEMVDNGINMKEMQMKLLQKMEEMTLYIIEQNNKNEKQSERIEQQNQEMKILKEKVEKLEKTSE